MNNLKCKLFTYPSKHNFFLLASCSLQDLSTKTISAVNYILHIGSIIRRSECKIITHKQKYTYTYILCCAILVHGWRFSVWVLFLG